MRQTLIILFGTLLSVLLLGLIISRVDMDQFVHTLENVHYGYIFLSSLIYVLLFYLRAIRWRELIYEHRGIETKGVLSAMGIGFLVNNIFPWRFGEILKAWLLGWKEKISKSMVFSTVLVERALDLIVLLLFLLFSLRYLDLSPHLHQAVLGMFAVGAIVITIMVVFHFSRHAHAQWIRRLWGLFPDKYSEKISSTMDSLLKGFVIYHHPLHFLGVIFLSLVIWILWGVGFVLALKGFDIEIPLAGILFAAAVINIGLVLPSSPGYLGTYQFLCVVALGVSGIETSQAFGFSLVFHALWNLPYTAIGLWYLWKENLSLSYLWKTGKEITAK